MAEAAGAYVAYEAVETVVEIGVGAYFIAKPVRCTAFSNNLILANGGIRLYH